MVAIPPEIVRRLRPSWGVWKYELARRLAWVGAPAISLFAPVVVMLQKYRWPFFCNPNHTRSFLRNDRPSAATSTRRMMNNSAHFRPVILINSQAVTNAQSEYETVLER